MIKLILMSAIIMSVSGLLLAETYYVDNTYGKNSNNGTSEISSWKTISKVNSFKFKSGDRILFKRGEVWKETLYINQDGSAEAPVIYGSYGRGVLPVIDGGSSRQHGIYMSGRNHIVIKDLKIQNTRHGAVRIKRSRDITVSNSEMYITGRAGVFIEESENCLILKNKMRTPAVSYNVQTDGIYAQRNADNIYDGNNIVISNQHSTQHCDAIQFYLETGATVKNNYVEQRNTKKGKAQGIYCSENSGTFRIYNNIGYGMYTASSLIKFKNTSTTGKAQIVGNTLYGGRSGLVQTNDPYVIFKNNILVTTGNNAVVNFEKALSSKSNVNFNLYKRKGSGKNIIVHDGKAFTFSKWKNAGYDENSIEKDPKFADISSKNFRLQVISPALNNGADMESPYNIDRMGTLRPFGTHTDMGAFEMKVDPKVNTSNFNKAAADEENIPEIYELEQNYPNPFNPSTTISFSIPENSMVTLKIYDITGSEVASLINDFRNAGNHQVLFDASSFASGTYIYVLTAKDFVQTKKMILLK